MKSLFLAMLVAGTALSATASFAQPPAPPPPGHHPFFEEMDANKDGVVTRAEVQAVLDKRFATIDTDKNGVISQAERQAHRQQASDERFKERFAARDTDKNGQLSPEELRTGRQKPDDAGAPPRDGKGFGMRGHGRGGWGKGGMDRGPKGDMTKEAFMQRSLTMFDLMDSNDDGKITAQERDAAMQRMRPHGPMNRGGDRPKG